MKSAIVLSVLMSLTLAGVAAAQDTVWIDATTPGALEKTINSDTVSGGARAHPMRAYGLHKDGVYVQKAGIVFKGGTTLTIIGEKGGAYPVVQMRPDNGVDPGDLTQWIANSVEGSLLLDHIYWIGKVTDGTLYISNFNCTTVNNLPQSMVLNDCVLEFAGFDWVTADGWTHGAKIRITNCYYRDLFSGEQWWAGRAIRCMNPIDTLWVENTTVSDGGLIFLQQNALCRFAYFNHNTFINTNKYWLLNGYYLNLYICNNLFTNQNWVGEDTVNVTGDGDDLDRLLMGTISVDTVTSNIQMQPEFRNPDGSVNQSLAGLKKLHIFVSNNISWTDTLLNSYYTNRGHHWNPVAPYPLSYLNWGGMGSGPWPIMNIPGIWANKRTLALFKAYPHNMAMTANIFTRVDTKTPSIKDASIVELMGEWNQNQWGDPAWPTPADLLHSSYTFGDQNPGTIPGYRNGVKTEDGDVRVGKISDFLESFAQAGTPVLSNIDNLPIGSLAWNDQTVPAGAYANVLTAYQAALTPVPPPPPAPVATAATNTSTISFTANWDSAGGATGYLLDVAADTNFSSILTNYNSLSVGNVLMQNVTGLSAGTRYFYRVRGSNDGGMSGNSNIISVATALALDTMWIPAGVAGALETTINGDTTTGGARKNPSRVYALRKDGVYVQNAGIVFNGGSTLTIVGEKGGAYPVVQMQPLNGVDPGDLTNGIANKVQGSLHLDHIYWIGKATDGTGYNQIFGMTTTNNLSQSCVVNDCIVEFPYLDAFNGDGWNHGSVWKFTNCYFRNFFNGSQWWAGRVMYCKKAIDTIWVENCTVTNGGLTFLQQEAVTRFAYFNHNTFINNNKYWLLNTYYQNLYICNNLFTNQNWVGEDTVNIASGGSDPDANPGHPLFVGTIGVDTITIRQQLFADMIKPDSTVDQTKVGLDRIRIYVSNNISWTDTLLNSYYKNYDHVWNTVGPYQLSYLDWGGLGNGPWRVYNQPGIWMNQRTAALFTAYPHHMAMTHNILDVKIDTKTPSIKDAGIVTLMGKWNQNQWGVMPEYANATANLLASAYCPGDQSAVTLPGFTNGVKSEDRQTAGVAKVSDFMENYDQSGAGTPVLSTIDNLPVGALHWHDATVPANSFAQIMRAFGNDIIIGIAGTPGLVNSYTLEQNYPNPFNPLTTIRYGLPIASHVTLAVYNTLGQQVVTLVDETQAVGYHNVRFDGTSLSSGVYFYRLQAGSFVATKRLALIR